MCDPSIAPMMPLMPLLASKAAETRSSSAYVVGNFISSLRNLRLEA